MAIKKALHEYYKDKSELYLPNGIAYKHAIKLKNISSHQLRKILDESKRCKQKIEISKDNFEKAKNQLFSLVPLAAYNAGRFPNQTQFTDLYEFLVDNLNQYTIQSAEDIVTFDELMTSIVAYHKSEGGK